MKKRIIFIIISILVLGITIFFLFPSPRADMVIYGNIYTGTNGDATSEAIAIKDGKYIYVGNSNDVKKYVGKNTEVLTYSDGLVLSGFTDTHTHVTPSFGVSEYDINIGDASSIEEYKEIITKYVMENPNKTMYVGRGWDNALFASGSPTKDILDEIIPDKPVFIKSNDGHAAWVNSKMIELINVSKDTEDPIGGKIEKDENGEPNGCLRDAAMDLYVKPNIEPYTIDQYKNLILKAQDFYAELGYTSYIEVFVESDKTNYNIYKAYEELDKEGKLKLRVQGAWNVSNSDGSLDNVKKLINYKEESKGGMFELTDVKIFMDGVAETKTAYLSEPYSDDIENYGADRWPTEEDFKKLVDCIILANKNDMVVHFHAIGDAAITKALDAVEEARNEFINPKIHNVITHLEIVKESDISRFKDLDIVVAANLSWGCIVEDIYESVEVKRLGEERAFKAYPYKSVLDAGAVVSLATDYPAGSVVSPIAGYLVAVTRNASDDESLARDASQKMTVDEALKAVTYGGAYQMRQESFRGTIEVGKVADLIVLDNNIMKNHTVADLNTTVLRTMVNGITIYEAKMTKK